MYFHFNSSAPHTSAWQDLLACTKSFIGNLVIIGRKSVFKPNRQVTEVVRSPSMSRQEELWSAGTFRHFSRILKRRRRSHVLQLLR